MRSKPINNGGFMHYYQFNIGDYARVTQHLDLLEDLAYRRMIDLYYTKESPLPESVEEISRLIRMRTHSDCIAIVLQDFFVLKDDGWHNNRADEELEKYQSKSEKARKSAQARWNNKQKTCERIPNAIRRQSEGNAKHKPITNNQETIKNHMSSGADNCPHEQIIKAYHDALPALPKVRVWNETRKKHLRTRWRENKKHQSLEFWEKMFNYISKSDFLMGRVSQGERKPFTASLDWIIKPENFAKIIEGKYHQ